MFGQALSRLERLLPLRWQRPATILRHRAIPDELWRITLERYPFLQWRSPAQQARLRALSTLFLAHKQFVPAGGFQLSDDIAVAVAAQACLPVLRLGLGVYGSFQGIVIHPDQVVAQREVMDEHGVVHHYEEVLSGEAMPGGPVMLSWRDVEQAQEAPWPYNVVVHEFAHALDMSGGELNGTPPLPSGIDMAQWREALWQAFDHHSDAQAHGDETWLDPYGLEDGLVEFFPVITEAFFVAPHAVRSTHPELYRLLGACFGDDPAAFSAASI